MLKVSQLIENLKMDRIDFNEKITQLYAQGRLDEIADLVNVDRKSFLLDDKDDLGDLIRYLVKEHHINLEANIVLENEDWDALTFYNSLYSKNLKDLGITPKYNYHYCASILWHACRSFSFKTVKYLVEQGANANSSSETVFQSTPLMVACAKNRLDVIIYLIEQANSDLNQLNIHGESCLFYALRNYDKQTTFPIILYLLKKGANVNIKNKYGRTPLHLSAEEKCDEDALILLVSHGAVSSSDNANESPLMTAALQGDISKFNYLYSKVNASNQEIIDALEIMGAILCEKSDTIEYSSFYWEISLTERIKAQIAKTPIRSYNGFLDEFQCKKDLVNVEESPVEFQMQSLWIRERILCNNFHMNAGAFNLTKCMVLSKYLLNMHPQLEFTQFTNSNFNLYKKLTNLWFYGFALQIQFLDPLHTNVVEGFFNFTLYVKAIVHAQVYLHSDENRTTFADTIVRLFQICMHELSRVFKVASLDDLAVRTDLKRPAIEKIKEKFPLRTLFERMFDVNVFKYYDLDTKLFDPEYAMNNLNTFFQTLMCLIRVVAFAKKLGYLEQRHLELVKQGLRLLISYRFKVNRGITTILSENLFEFNHVDGVSLVSYELIELLLESGADPNEPDESANRDTALNYYIHLNSMLPKDTVDSIISLLLKNGAHYDYVNSCGQTLATIYDRKYDSSITTLVKPLEHLSLKCFCARVINSNKLQYERVLPAHLVDFVKRH